MKNMAAFVINKKYTLFCKSEAQNLALTNSFSSPLFEPWVINKMIIDNTPTAIKASDKVLYFLGITYCSLSVITIFLSMR
jgi:hypothetical protein